VNCKRSNAAGLLTKATGGVNHSFLTQNTVERLIMGIGEELHAEYVLSFAPPLGGAAEEFRAIQVMIKDRLDLAVRTRAGYWLTSE
jgi:hypothetical protein